MYKTLQKRISAGLLEVSETNYDKQAMNGAETQQL